MVTLIKEIGTDALFALQRTLRGRGARARSGASTATAATNDLAVCGRADRRQGRPLQGARTSRTTPTCTCESSSIRRARASSCGAPRCTPRLTPNSNEIIVLPTRAMGRTTPTTPSASPSRSHTKGLKLYVSPYAAGDRNSLEFPLSSRHKMLETLTVFDDVFVPWERVFVCRQPELGRPVGADLRRVPPLHRGLLQAPAARRAGRRGRRDRRDERRDPGRPHPGQAHAAHHLRARPSAALTEMAALRGPDRRRRHRRTPTP